MGAKAVKRETDRAVHRLAYDSILTPSAAQRLVDKRAQTTRRFHPAGPLEHTAHPKLVRRLLPDWLSIIVRTHNLDPESLSMNRT